MKRTTFIRALCLLLALTCFLPIAASCKKQKNESTTTTTTSKPKKDFNDFLYSGETVKLYGSDLSPVIYVDPSDYKQSVRAVGDLLKDFERVTGKKPKVVYNETDLAGAELAIIIGTLGKSTLVTYLEEEGYIGLDEIKGQWEAYNLSVVENPTENIKKAVVVAGSDKRGTIYGTYTISELIGVSPWYFWGDVEIEHKDEIVLPIEKLKVTEMPDVQYRGIFINDEETFTNWSAQFVSKNSPGKPNPGTYKHVFELLLRLKANCLWPAMHACSDAFNEYKNPETGISYNAELADDYGIVMSASHCEMLLRNNECEWVDWCTANQGKHKLTKVNNSWRDSYDYTVNAEAMNAYWEERVAENYRFENIYMIGLRGVHDSGILCSKLTDKSYRGKATVVKKAVEAQLEILAKYEKKYEEETGEAIKFKTAYCVYKEAAEYFKYDIGLPKDCCLMYAEDNHGYIRSTVSDKDKKNYESFGMYYHVSYWGRPASYLWISSTPLQIMAEEMRKSYYTGTDDFWILNVGDIKPAEVKTEYFMDLAWDIESHTEHNTEEFTVRFLKQNFGLDDATAKAFADTYTEFNQLMRSFYPEIIDKHSDKGNYDLSVINFGSEGLLMVEELTEIYNRSLAIYKSLPEGKQESFYELFHYTVYSYLLIVEKHVYQHMNELCVEQGRLAAANLYADLAERAYLQILAEVDYYNKDLADGKWDKIMDPYISSNPSPEGAPVVKRFSAADTARKVMLSAEGQLDINTPVTLKFGSLNDNIRYLDVANLGAAKENWALTLPSYVIVTDGEGKVVTGTKQGTNVVYTGTVEIQERLFLTIDWEVLAKGETKTGEGILTDDHGTVSKVNISATKSAIDPSKETNKGYYEENGLVSIEAEHFTSNVAKSGYEWKYIDGLGRSGGVMMALSQTENKGFVNTIISSGFKDKSPYLEYMIYFNTTGSYKGTFYRLPTLNETATSTQTYCSTAWSLDGSTPKRMNGTTTADDADHSAWGNMIKLHIEELKMNITINEPGWHTLRIYMVNSLQAFDQIVFTQDKNVESRYNAPETFNTVSEWKRPEVAALNSYSLGDVVWNKYSGLFDFTTSSTQAGYVTVDASKGSLKDKGWEWESVENIKAYMRSASKMHTVDNGFITSSQEATFKVQTPGAGKYALTVTVGDPQNGIKTQNMSIKSGSKTLIDNINVSGGVEHFGFVAEADQNGVIELTFSGTWTVGSLEVYSYTERAETGKGAFIAGQNGHIVIEVEDALENSEFASVENSKDNAGYTWMNIAGQYGNGLYYGPNKGGSNASTDVEGSTTAKIHLSADIQKAGKYQIWALVKCSGDNDDSVIVSLGGKQAITKNDIRETNGFTWVMLGTYTVKDTGVTELTVLGREDGFAIDRIILAYDGAPVNYNAPCIRAE